MSYLSPLRVYLLSHMVAQKFILDFLDTRPEVLNWFSIPPANVLMVSKSDLAALTGLLHVSYPWLHFTLVEVDPTRINGFMNPQVWDFVNNPRSSGRWE